MDQTMKPMLEDAEFRSLNLPLSDEAARMLEQMIRKGYCHDPVIVWQGRIIEGYERYELYQRYQMPWLIREKNFRDRCQAIIWICRRQLERGDLNPNAEAWLISRLYAAEFRSREQSPALFPEGKSDLQPGVKGDIQQKICNDCHISEATLRRYVIFGKQLDELEERFPGIRQRILTGELKVAREHMKALLEMPEAVFRRMAEDPACRKLVPPNQDRSKTGALRLLRRMPPQSKPLTGIKQMPAYDPDAELNGLTFTVGAWERTVSRTRKLANFQAATREDKEHLLRALAALTAEIRELNHELGSGG